MIHLIANRIKQLSFRLQKEQQLQRFGHEIGAFKRVF